MEQRIDYCEGYLHMKRFNIQESRKFINSLNPIRIEFPSYQYKLFDDYENLPYIFNLASYEFSYKKLKILSVRMLEKKYHSELSIAYRNAYSRNTTCLKYFELARLVGDNKIDEALLDKILHDKMLGPLFDFYKRTSTDLEYIAKVSDIIST